MDEKTADAKGLDPLKPELDRIAAVKNKADLIDVIAHDHMIGANALFAFYSSSDLHNADTVIAYIDQGGLTLPDRDYYIKDDDKHKEMRQHLVDYVDPDVHPRRQDARRSGRRRANHPAHRDRARQGGDGPHPAPRSEESRPQDEAR